ncbi:MAG: hypothetical protein UW94_C0013G0018 [Parcubacteria group bacterium GW2011_GWA2_45_14]|nr:MAG: hypothetical protein UW94_C0013G0018 [Parcubacteria group bacterium GW2011_GWA2_45_14]OGY35562.1 MAG: hypothetical protein A3B76_02190 [Candidatus Andersenbacteria bacterium RIFCSPHIGHO2_02_FULL_46_16]
MKIIVHVKPRSSQAKVEQISDEEYKVWVRAVPEKGRANEEMQQLLADYFQIKRSAVRLVIGKTAREKLVEIIGK